MPGAYEGIRILDFTQGVAGPMATGLLAQQHADVIKVESPGGDRKAGHPGYVAWNCNKRRIVLDLESPAGMAAARKLIADADVAVFDAAPGELERLGLDGPTLSAAHPTLIHAWMPMYGTTGRWANVYPEDSLLSAASCVSFAQATWEDVPVHLVTPQVSYGHGILAAGVIGAALFERESSGLGQSLVCSGVHGYAAVRTGGAIRAAGMMRMGAGRGARGGSPNYRLYQCADGEWLFLGTLTMPFFLRALEALDLIEILAMEGVDGEIANIQRPPMNEVVINRLDQRFAEKSRSEWLAILHANGVPAGPVGERNDWFAGEQVAANEMRVELTHPQLGPVSVPGVSAKLTKTPGAVTGLMTDATPESVAERTSRWTPPSNPTPRNAHGPLTGIRVLDLGNVIAGPFGPTILSNYGADVIKVETPDGDTFRTAALGFAGWNRGKRSIVIDLKTEDGRQTFYDLVRTCDAVVDNFRRGVTERLQIDYERLRAVKPDIITVSVMGYGPGGPLGGDPGFDPVLQARSGMMKAQGGDDEPVFHTVPVNDEASGLMGAFSVIAALNARKRTGEGQHVWTALANQTIVCQSGEVTTWPGRPEGPHGGRDFPGVSALHGLYSCADTWIALAALEDVHWPALANALGQPAWSSRWDASSARGQAHDSELGNAIGEVLRTLTAEDAIAKLEAAGVPAVIAIRPEDSHDDPWLNANGFWETYQMAPHGEVQSVRGYAEFARTPGGFRYPAPGHGEHSAEILKEIGR